MSFHAIIEYAKIALFSCIGHPFRHRPSLPTHPAHCLLAATSDHRLQLEERLEVVILIVTVQGGLGVQGTIGHDHVGA